MPVTYPLINGHAYSHASVVLNAKGKDFLGITEVNYNDSLEPGVGRGTSARKLNRTLGEYDCEADFTMHRADFEELKRELGPGFKTVEFDVLVSYAEDGSPVVTDMLWRCRISKNEVGSSGTDPNTVKCTLHCMDILWDGVSSLKNDGR